MEVGKYYTMPNLFGFRIIYVVQSIEEDTMHIAHLVRIGINDSSRGSYSTRGHKILLEGNIKKESVLASEDDIKHITLCIMMNKYINIKNYEDNK